MSPNQQQDYIKRHPKSQKAKKKKKKKRKTKNKSLQNNLKN